MGSIDEQTITDDTKTAKMTIRAAANWSHEPRHVLLSVSQIPIQKNKRALARPLKLKEPQSHEFQQSDNQRRRDRFRVNLTKAAGL